MSATPTATRVIPHRRIDEGSLDIPTKPKSRLHRRNGSGQTEGKRKENHLQNRRISQERRCPASSKSHADRAERKAGGPRVTCACASLMGEPSVFDSIIAMKAARATVAANSASGWARPPTIWSPSCWRDCCSAQRHSQVLRQPCKLQLPKCMAPEMETNDALGSIIPVPVEFVLSFR